MAFQSLYRRYRPRRFDEVRGQDHVVRALRNAVRDGNVAHAYLFSGPRGTGKTSTARILARALNCESPVDGEPDGTCEACLAMDAGSSFNVIELDAASNRGIDDARELVRGAAMTTGGRWKVYILDEVHQLTSHAASVLLKTLEEPPAHVVFVLATTDPQKVLPTIRSRTQHFDFRLLPAATLAEHLRWVAADAGLGVTDAAVDLAVRRGHGSARDALSALDQIAAAGGELDDDASIDEMVEGLCERDTARALTAVASACASGRDPRQLATALLGHLRECLLSVLAPEVVALPDTARERVADQGRRLGPPATVRALDAVGEGVIAMRDAPDPRVVLEVALVRVTRPELDASPAALLERVERLERTLRGGGGAGPPAAPRAAEPAATPPAPSAPAIPSGSQPALGALRHQRERAQPSAPPPDDDPPPPPPPPTVADPSLPSREELTVTWADRVLGGLRPTAKGLFAGGRFVRVDSAAVFALPSEALRAKAERMQGDVEAVLATCFGRPVPLRLVVDGSAAAGPASAPNAPPPPADDEVIDLDELVDAPEARSGIDQLTEAFPGARLVDE